MIICVGGGYWRKLYNMKEIWKDIPEFEGMYQASTLGRIKSLERVVDVGLGLRTFPEKIKCQTKTPLNYMVVRLSKNGKLKTYNVHRLIALTFIPNPNGYNEIDHINDVSPNQCDNSINNLRWCDRSFNLKKRKPFVWVKNRK